VESQSATRWATPAADAHAPNACAPSVS